MNARLVEFLRFSTIGGLSAVTGWLLLYVLTTVLGFHYLLGFALSFVLLNGLAFLLLGTYAFRGARARDARALWRYYLVSAASLAGNSLALMFLVEEVGMWYLPACVLLTLLNTPLNYLLHRRWSFRVGRNGSLPV